MNPLIFWPVLATVLLAAAVDLRTRRIPNWLTLPFLVGGAVVNAGLTGWTGIGQSFQGIGVAILIVGGLCMLRTMGFGDLKLCAAVGAWIGPSSLLFALVVTAMAGGVLVLAIATWRGNLAVVLGRTANLSLPDATKGFQDFHAEGLTIPYAPAIATGVLFALFAV
ncbi:MAG: prepilin peptidase [Bryobacteraceae bacterium]